MTSNNNMNLKRKIASLSLLALMTGSVAFLSIGLPFFLVRYPKRIEVRNPAIREAKKSFSLKLSTNYKEQIYAK